jgi:hypothetical protein
MERGSDGISDVTIMRRIAHEAATHAINKMPAAWEGYARAYWIHLAEGTRQPNPGDYGVTSGDAQQVRINGRVGLSLGTLRRLLDCLPIRVPFRQSRERIDGTIIHFSAIFTHTAEKSIPSHTIRPIVPLRAIPPLQYPLQRIIDNPPTIIELGYDAICGLLRPVSAYLVP